MLSSNPRQPLQIPKIWMFFFNRVAKFCVKEKVLEFSSDFKGVHDTKMDQIYLITS